MAVLLVAALLTVAIHWLPLVVVIVLLVPGRLVVRLVAVLTIVLLATFRIMLWWWCDLLLTLGNVLCFSLFLMQ